MRKITIMSAVLVCLAIISCKENATSKINTENLETAKEREKHLLELFVE